MSVAESSTRIAEALPAPETVSVEIAAARLGLSRTKAYELARTENCLGAGIPVLRFGRKMAVPVRAIDRVLMVDINRQPTAIAS